MLLMEIYHHSFQFLSYHFNVDDPKILERCKLKENFTKMVRIEKHTKQNLSRIYTYLLSFLAIEDYPVLTF